MTNEEDQLSLWPLYLQTRMFIEWRQDECTITCPCPKSGFLAGLRKWKTIKHMQDMLYFDMLAKVQVPCMTYETLLTVYGAGCLVWGVKVVVLQGRPIWGYPTFGCGKLCQGSIFSETLKCNHNLVKNFPWVKTWRGPCTEFYDFLSFVFICHLSLIGTPFQNVSLMHWKEEVPPFDMFFFLNIVCPYIQSLVIIFSIKTVICGDTPYFF